MALISMGGFAAFDDIVDEAIEDMKSVQLPTYYFDIFKRSVLDDAKALFSTCFKRDPTPGKGFSDLSQRCELKLEGYFTDKILSCRVRSHVITEILRRLEKSITDFRKEGDVTKWFWLRNFQINTIFSFGFGDQFAGGSFREVCIETRFMNRVTERLRIDMQTKVLKELPIPQFNHPKSREVLENEIKNYFECPEICNVDLMYFPKEEVEDVRKAQTYMYTIFQTRNERMLKILKAAFQKDLEERALNPDAPLTNLVKLESYEKAISRQRQKLCAKVATVAVFFFCIGAVLLFSRIVLRK